MTNVRANYTGATSTFSNTVFSEKKIFFGFPINNIISVFNVCHSSQISEKENLVKFVTNTETRKLFVTNSDTNQSESKQAIRSEFKQAAQERMPPHLEKRRRSESADPQSPGPASTVSECLTQHCSLKGFSTAKCRQDNPPGSRCSAGFRSDCANPACPFPRGNTSPCTIRLPTLYVSKRRRKSSSILAPYHRAPPVFEESHGGAVPIWTRAGFFR